MASDLLRTSDIAKTLGVHANTVRNYEKWGYLPEIPRGENGYRAFTAVHLEQTRLACLVLQWPYLGERTPLVHLVQSAARQEFNTALAMANNYLTQIRKTQAVAETAVQLLEHWVNGRLTDTTTQTMTISQTAAHLNVTVETLRNWERNGLIDVPRQPSNQYRIFGATEFARLRVIRQLVQAGFSLMAISHTLQWVDGGKTDNLREALTLPPHERANEAIDVMGDHWLPSLQEMEQQAQTIIQQINRLIQLVDQT
ncbi:MAG: MerR family transcriptional regulator [Anaerolineaceae bacterium]|nr:MerR family transcriptional regulator [Anaerolineaceae bacterium]